MVSSNEILSVIDARVPSLKQQSFIWSSGLVVQFFAQWLIGILLVRMGSYEIGDFCTNDERLQYFCLFC